MPLPQIIVTAAAAATAIAAKTTTGAVIGTYVVTLGAILNGFIIQNILTTRSLNLDPEQEQARKQQLENEAALRETVSTTAKDICQEAQALIERVKEQQISLESSTASFTGSVARAQTTANQSFTLNNLMLQLIETLTNMVSAYNELKTSFTEVRNDLEKTKNDLTLKTHHMGELVNFTDKTVEDLKVEIVKSKLSRTQYTDSVQIIHTQEEEITRLRIQCSKHETIVNDFTNQYTRFTDQINELTQDNTTLKNSVKELLVDNKQLRNQLSSSASEEHKVPKRITTQNASYVSPNGVGLGSRSVMFPKGTLKHKPADETNGVEHSNGI